MERKYNVYYTNFMSRGKREFFSQILYYVEIFEGNRFDCSEFFDSQSSVLDFGSNETSSLNDPKIYVTRYQLSRSRNGRFVLNALDKRRVFL